MTQRTCTYTERVYCETARVCPSLRAYLRQAGAQFAGRCPGHLVSRCPEPPIARLKSTDGWGQQYACAQHVDHPHFADYPIHTPLETFPERTPQ